LPDDPTVNAVLSATVVAPLRLAAPVPVANVFELVTEVSPFRLTAPVPVANVPLLETALKLPALMVMPLSTVRVGNCILGKYSLLDVPNVEAQKACTKEEAGTL